MDWQRGEVNERITDGLKGVLRGEAGFQAK
jgi:hypothetical protein